MIGVYKILTGNISSDQMPSRVHFLDKIPENSHGKINRHMLKSKVMHSGEEIIMHSYSESESDVRRLLFDCWESFCASKPKGEDNFVLCGGDSFTALSFINILRYPKPCT